MQPDQSPDNLGARLKIALDQLNIKQRELARRISKTGDDDDISKLSSSINNLIKRNSKKSDLTTAICLSLNINRMWLESGVGQMIDFQQNTGDTINNGLSFGFCEIKGHLRMTENDGYNINITPIAVATHKIAIMNWTPNTKCLQIRGSELQPALYNGWIVAIDKSAELISNQMLLIALKDGRTLIGVYQFADQYTVTVQSLKTQQPRAIDRDQIDYLAPITSITMPNQIIPKGH